MNPGRLTRLLAFAAEAVATQPVPDAEDDRELVLRATETVAYELVGFSDRIRAACERAAKVNGTPRPVPVKPVQPKSPPKPPPPPPKNPKNLRGRIEALEAEVVAVTARLDAMADVDAILGRVGVRPRQMRGPATVRHLRPVVDDR